MEDDSNVLIDMEKKKVTLSMILKWYSVDFGKNNQEVLEFIVNYLTGVSNIESPWPVIHIPRHSVYQTLRSSSVRRHEL